MEDDESMEESSDESSVDSIAIEEVLEMWGDPWTDGLMYLCRTSDESEEVYDRSDLMDGGKHQKLVIRFERNNPPPWDDECQFCGEGGCEECQCQEVNCDRPCRMINGTNYGCVCHPVV